MFQFIVFSEYVAFCCWVVLRIYIYCVVLYLVEEQQPDKKITSPQNHLSSLDKKKK